MRGMRKAPKHRHSLRPTCTVNQHKCGPPGFPSDIIFALHIAPYASIHEGHAKKVSFGQKFQHQNHGGCFDKASLTLPLADSNLPIENEAPTHKS